MIRFVLEKRRGFEGGIVGFLRPDCDEERDVAVTAPSAMPAEESGEAGTAASQSLDQQSIVISSGSTLHGTSGACCEPVCYAT